MSGPDVPPLGDEIDPDLLREELDELVQALPNRLDAGDDDLDVGLARLVLTLIEFVRRVLEHQAVRRLEAGTLTEDEEERLGLALMRLEERMVEMRQKLGLDEEDLQVDLGPLGKLL